MSGFEQLAARAEAAEEAIEKLSKELDDLNGISNVHDICEKDLEEHTKLLIENTKLKYRINILKNAYSKEVGGKESTCTYTTNIVETLMNYFNIATKCCYPNLSAECPIKPSTKGGDYQYSGAMKIAGLLNASGEKTAAIDIAKSIVKSIPENECIQRLEIVGPGFVNIHLHDWYKKFALAQPTNTILKGSAVNVANKDLVHPEVKNPSQIECFWLSSFKWLVENDELEDNLAPMWIQFKSLTCEDILETMHKNPGHFSDEEKEKMKMFKDMQELVSKSPKMKSVSDNELFYKILVCVRDRKSCAIGMEKTIPVIVGGETKFYTNQELEDEFMKDFDLQTTCVPQEHINNDDMDEHMNLKAVIDKMEENFEKQFDKNLERAKFDNRKKNPEELKKQVMNETISWLHETKEYEWTKSRNALEGERKVHCAIFQAITKHKIPAYIMSGIKTVQDIGSYLDEFGIKISKIRGHRECEHDILSIAATENGVKVTFVEVKTNQFSKPWKPEKIEQKVDKNLVNDGTEQLQRNCLRLMEFCPDIEMKNVAFETLLAFPYAESENTKQQNSVKILTKQYFEKGNEKKLLNELGIPSSQNTISTATWETYQKCVCRYLGMHSQVELKTKAQSFFKVEQKMNLVIEANETMMEATASQDDEDTDSEKIFAMNDKVSKVISSDILMRGIKSAKGNKDYRKKFKRENPNLNLNLNNLQLKDDKLQDQFKKYPLYGQKLIKRVLEIIDEDCAHQGIKTILEMIRKNKYEFFTEEAVPIVIDEAVKMHVTNCEHCNEVQEIKKLLVKEPGKSRLTVPENMMARVLSYGDRHHRGYHEINRRLKSWTYFKDYENKIRSHVAICQGCGSRSSYLLLSREQREAISKQDGFKFIMGHYGSGKTLLGRLICQKDAVINKRKNVIYVVFSKTSQGLELQQRFKDEFQSDNEINIQTYSRRECCEKYKVEESYDNASIIENIVSKVEEDSVILFDECPMESHMKEWENNYDWSNLNNTRKNVTLVVCLQPIQMKPELYSASSEVLCPRSASVVELNIQYRNSKNILNLVNSLRKGYGIGGCRYNKMDGEAGHDVNGPKVTAVYLNTELAIDMMEGWLDQQLRKLGATQSQVKVIHDRHSLAMARQCCPSSLLLTSLEEYQGCEIPVAVVIFSAQLLELCGRAQFKLFLVINHNQILWDNLPSDVTRVTSETIESMLWTVDKTKLMDGVSHNRIEDTNQLLKLQEIDVNIRNVYNQTAVQYACFYNSPAIVEMIGSVPGVEVNTVNIAGDTALITAVRAGNMDCVGAMLNIADIDVNTVDKSGDTAVLLATRMGHKGVLKALLDFQGVDLTIKDSQNMTAYQHACTNRDMKETFDTALWAASRTELMACAAENKIEQANHLVNFKEVDVNLKNMFNQTAVQYACKYNSPAIVEMIGSVPGVEVNTVNMAGDTALITAVRAGNMDCVGAMLNITDIDVNAVDMRGDTAVLLATGMGHTDILRTLVTCPDINVTVVDSSIDGHNALIIACKNKKLLPCVEILSQHSNMDINHKDKYDWTALHYACRHNNEQAVEMLGRATGVKLNTQDNIYGRTPLITAVVYNSPACVRALLTMPGLQCNIKDKYGNTAVMWALRYGHKDVLRVLVQSGLVDMQTVDGSGRTLVQVARDKEDPEFLQIVTMAGGQEM